MNKYVRVYIIVYFRFVYLIVIFIVCFLILFIVLQSVQMNRTNWLEYPTIELYLVLIGITLLFVSFYISYLYTFCISCIFSFHICIYIYLYWFIDSLFHWHARTPMDLFFVSNTHNMFFVYRTPGVMRFASKRSIPAIRASQAQRSSDRVFEN